LLNVNATVNKNGLSILSQAAKSGNEKLVDMLRKCLKVLLQDYMHLCKPDPV
jgi:hypothetical protein